MPQFIWESIVHRKTAAALLMAAYSFAYAGEFAISPVRIFMKTRERSVAITVSNNADEDLLIQSEVFAWAQKPDGTDDLTATEDVALSPPIAKIPPNSRQVFRLVRVGPPPVGTEQTYRVIVREVPEAKAAQKTGQAVQMAMAFSLPIFVTPPGAKREIACRPAAFQPDRVTVTCENKGLAYAFVRTFALTDEAGTKLAFLEPGGYVLPDVRRTFELKAAGKVPAGRAKLQVTLDDATTQTYDLDIAK